MPSALMFAARTIKYYKNKMYIFVQQLRGYSQSIQGAKDKALYYFVLLYLQLSCEQRYSWLPPSLSLLHSYPTQVCFYCSLYSLHESWILYPVHWLCHRGDQIFSLSQRQVSEERWTHYCIIALLHYWGYGTIHVLYKWHRINSN